MEYLKIANSAGLWIACLPLLIVVAGQVIVIYRRACKASSLVGLTHEERNTAFKVGLITAIGPSFGSFIVIIGMAAVMGAPATWQRVSVIASAGTELRACQYTAEAIGIQLGGAGFTMTVFDACLWVMALNGCGWMLFCLLFTDKMSKFTNKITGGSTALLSTFAASAIIATVMYMSSSYIMSVGPNLVALLSAAASRYLLDFIGKKHPKFGQWTFSIAFLIGMFCGALYKSLV